MNTAWEHDTACEAPCLKCGEGSCPIMGIACSIKEHYCDTCAMLVASGTKWVTYMVTCSDGTIYTGATNNLEKRLKAHNSGKGAKYTKTRLPVKLASVFLQLNKSDAMKLEYKIKQLSRNDKLDIIAKYRR